MTPAERAAAAMKEAQGGPVVTVSPERTEAIIARHIEEAVADALASGWRDAETDPPPYGHAVLAWSAETRRRVVASLDHEWGWDFGGCNPEYHQPVTHWRELPEPPP